MNSHAYILGVEDHKDRRGKPKPLPPLLPVEPPRNSINYLQVVFTFTEEYMALLHLCVELYPCLLGYVHTFILNNLSLSLFETEEVPLNLRITFKDILPGKSVCLSRRRRETGIPRQTLLSYIQTKWRRLAPPFLLSPDSLIYELRHRVVVQRRRAFVAYGREKRVKACRSFFSVK